MKKTLAVLVGLVTGGTVVYVYRKSIGYFLMDKAANVLMRYDDFVQDSEMDDAYAVPVQDD